MLSTVAPLLTLAVNPMSGGSVLSTFGALGVLVVTFAESGLLVVGFFLPGDTLLFPAGVLCATGGGGGLSLWQVLVCAAVGAIAGGQFSYEIGRRGGRTMLARSRSRQLKRGVARAEGLLARYGYGKAVVLGKFIPMARSVLGPVAGMLEVPGRVYTVWQAVGAVLWTQSLVLAGFFLGSSVPHVDQYLLPAVAFIVIVSMLPLALQIRRGRRGAAQGREGDEAAQPWGARPSRPRAPDCPPLTVGCLA